MAAVGAAVLVGGASYLLGKKVHKRRLKAFTHLNDIKDTLEIGDLIEFRRQQTFFHYAMFIGNGEVMNINAEDKTVKIAKIERKKLEEVCRGDKVRVKNHTETAFRRYKRVARSESEMIEAALSFENQTVHYEFMRRNCEFYATMWRYGLGFSRQVCEPTYSYLATRIRGNIPGAGVPIRAASITYRVLKSPYEMYRELSADGRVQSFVYSNPQRALPA